MTRRPSPQETELRIDLQRAHRLNRDVMRYLSDGDREALDPHMWVIWQDKARREGERAEAYGTRLALADRALRSGTEADRLAYLNYQETS